MANFCLLHEYVDKFKQGLISGEIDPAKLAEMSSSDRRAFLSKYVGERSAKEVNAAFESKLLLKNQRKGMTDWARSVAGLKPDAKRNLLDKIENMKSILNPVEQAHFLNDLAEQRLGVGVTQKEAKVIADMSQRVSDAKALMNKDGTFKNDTDRFKYGEAVIDLKNRVSELKGNAMSLSLADFKNPLKGVGKTFSTIAGNAKAITASLDNSALLRQGWKTMWSHPLIWADNAARSFSTIVKTLGGQDVMRAIEADIVSRPTYGLMQKAKLAVGNLEEAYPTTLPEKIPVFGRVYRASEAAFTGFIQKTRADVFDKYLKIAERSGVDIQDPKELRAIGNMVNSQTGRGGLGKLEPVGNVVNNVFFSPRFLASNLHTLSHVVTGGGEGSNFVRKQAAISLLKVVSGTATIMAISNALSPGSVELDPRSSDFGKIRVGDTRFDITGGMGSIAVLAARLVTMSSKSATTGKVTQLGSGQFGAQTGLDVLNNFADNKLSPVGGIIRDLLRNKDMNGQKPTIGNELGGAFTPLGIQNYYQTVTDPAGANALLTLIADGLGISANTYSAQANGNQSSWSQSTSVKVQAFKGAVSSKDFTAAASTYDNTYNAWIAGIKNNPQYKGMSDATKAKLITAEKAKLETDILKQYNFTYKAAKADPAQKGLFKSLESPSAR